MTTAKGHIWPAEWRTIEDLETGLPIRQLTNYKAHSHHLYFTNPGWHDGGRRVLIASDRNNLTMLLSLDLQSGEMLQLTDTPLPSYTEDSYLFTCVNPTREEAYFWRGRDLIALDLQSLQERSIYHAPDGFLTNILNCSADGRFVCTGLSQDLSSELKMDLLHGYVGFAEFHDAKPLSKVLRIAVDGSRADVVWEENYWIGHVNTSPKLPHLLSFCHEGPWDKVDNRIWGLNLETGKVWPIRRSEPGETVGHEYWLSDGEMLGYHGHIGGQPVFGFVRYDDTGKNESVMAAHSVHFHSNTQELVVGDGNGRQPYVLLWQRADNQWQTPRILCKHRGSWHVQQNHVHPRFSPDGTQVLYTTDHSGYGNVYLADVPPLEELPLLDESKRSS